MTDRVLSTQAAKEAISKMQAIITGPLMDTIKQLDNQGRILSDSNVWDGNLAVQFRSQWQSTHATLEKTEQALEELRANIQKINLNIMSAGGNQ